MNRRLGSGTAARYQRKFKAFVRKNYQYVIWTALFIAITALIWIPAEKPMKLFQHRRTNYASPQNGAEVITCGPNTTPMSHGYYHVFRFKTSEVVSNPMLAIEPGDLQGFCFKGSKGTIVIKLSTMITVSTVMVQHIDEQRTNISTSMPKDFKIYGSLDNKNYIYLGSFIFDKDGLTQEFPFKKTDPVYYVKVEINSNWGIETHTCLYGVRVFGAPSAPIYSAH